jgi:hypothetical protein
MHSVRETRFNHRSAISTSHGSSCPCYCLTCCSDPRSGCHQVRLSTFALTPEHLEALFPRSHAWMFAFAAAPLGYSFCSIDFCNMNVDGAVSAQALEFLPVLFIHSPKFAQPFDHSRPPEGRFHSFNKRTGCCFDFLSITVLHIVTSLRDSHRPRDGRPISFRCPHRRSDRSIPEC